MLLALCAVRSGYIFSAERVNSALSAMSMSCVITAYRSHAPTCSAFVSHMQALHGCLYDHIMSSARPFQCTPPTIMQQ